MKERPADWHLYPEAIQMNEQHHGYMEYYDYLKNSIGFTYEELVGMGYTEELGFTREVFEKVYDKDHPMEGGYIIESSGEIVPIMKEHMIQPPGEKYYVEGEASWELRYASEYITESPKE